MGLVEIVCEEGFCLVVIINDIVGVGDSMDAAETLDAEVKAFFDSAPPLHNSHDITQKLNHFIQRNSSPSGK